MAGQWSASRFPGVSLHTYTAPPDGWEVTSHIVELASQLLIVDAQYRISYAREVSDYALRLDKPMTRLYVTHYHPDHLLGACAIDVPMYTLASVARKIEEMGDRVASEEHEKVGDDIPAQARRPDHVVHEGDEVLDDVLIQHRSLRMAETEEALVLGLPDVRSVIVQDLVYDRCHLFLGEKRFDDWREQLRHYRALPYDLVLPGHGLPGSLELYDWMIEYLDFAESALRDTKDRDDFRRCLLERFPRYGARQILDHQSRFLFR